MVFMTIGLIVTAIVTVLCIIMYAYASYGFTALGAFVGAFVAGLSAIILAVLLPGFWSDARINKALIQSHLENPSNYTYTQLAEHNELVTKLRVWQGTIFSFYNDVDLKTIDIDSVSQKVIVEPKK